MIKVFTFLLYFFAFSTLLALVKKLMKRLNEIDIEKQREEQRKNSCLCCKYLVIMNDGSGECEKNLINLCSKNGYRFKEPN